MGAYRPTAYICALCTERLAAVYEGQPIADPLNPDSLLIAETARLSTQTENPLLRLHPVKKMFLK